MCVAAIAWHAHPRWPLVVVANRDELHEREAAPLARWQDGSGIIAGRDLRSGGTWLGLSEAGRLTLVTNLRGYGLADPHKQSRGGLVTGLLTGALDPQSLDAGPYNPFNLIHIADGKATFLSNRPDTLRTELASGIFGLSNGTLDEPWPKTLQLKAALLDWLVRGEGESEALFAALRREDLPDYGIRPDRPSDMPREAPDTPVFIRDPVYGTRCSTVLIVDADGNGTVAERSFANDGRDVGRTTIEFTYNSATFQNLYER